MPLVVWMVYTFASEISPVHEFFAWLWEPESTISVEQFQDV